MSALAAWHEAGRTLRVLDQDVFVREAGPASRAAEARPTLLLLHGFPSSSFDFHLVLPALAERHRVVVHDHPGFGFSSKRFGPSYSLIEQAEVALELWRALGVGRAILVSHDYGTSVATEVLARRARARAGVEVVGASFSNGSMLLELARPRLSQYVLASPLGPLLARLANERFFRRQLRAILRRPVDEQELSAMWEGLHHGGGELLLPKLSHYNKERVKFRERWMGALRDAGLPTLLLWAEDDPVARIEVAEQLARDVPGASLVRLPGVGHYPTLEAPAEWASELLRFVGSVP